METIKKLVSLFCHLFTAFFILAFLGGLIVLVVILKGGVGEDDLSSLRIKTDHAVGVVEVLGEIYSSTKVRRELEKFLNNEKIKGIVVRIDSSGGLVGASEEIYRDVKRAASKKPVVCSLGSVAASGGLYVASGCSAIVVNKGTLTGSIGVLMMMPDLTGVFDKLGVGMNVIKSGRFKDTGSPFRKLDAEDRRVIQGVADTAYEQFVNVIAESRKLEPRKVKEFADGRVIVGEEAMRLGLADAEGGVNEAARIALEQIGDKSEPELVYSTSARGMLGMLFEAGESKLFHFVRLLGEARLLYRAF